MSDHGWGFGVDLYHLDQVAKRDLPTVSGIYGDALSKCNSMETGLDGIVAVPAQFSGKHGPVFSSLVTLNGAITGVLQSTKTSLDESAKALSDSVKLYEEADHAAAERFRQLIENRGTPKPEATS